MVNSALLLASEGFLDWLQNVDRAALLAVNGSDSLFLDSVVHVLTTAITWLPLYLSLFYLVVKNHNSLQRIGLIVGCAGLCILFAGAVDDLIVKPLVGRWRPTHDPVIGTLVDVVNGYRGGKYGFFSAHACNTFGIAVFFCWLVRSRLLSTALVLWSLVNCWTRLYLGVHFPGDILCGLLWGAIGASLAYLLYHRLRLRLTVSRRLVSSQYTSTGYLHSDVNIVVAVLVFTLVYALLRACLFLYE